MPPAYRRALPCSSACGNSASASPPGHASSAGTRPQARTRAGAQGGR
ncbi:MAG: hypothetical protein WAW52_09905 [Methanothrix sp.]